MLKYTFLRKSTVQVKVPGQIFVNTGSSPIDNGVYPDRVKELVNLFWDRFRFSTPYVLNGLGVQSRRLGGNNEVVSKVKQG
jgi:hypothetical protein